MSEQEPAPPARLDARRGYHNRRAQIAGTAFTAVWLVYLIGPIADLFSHHYSEPYRWGGLTLIVVFSVIYVIMVPKWPTPSRYRLPGLAALALLAAVTCVTYGVTDPVAIWIFVSSASGLVVANRRWAARAVLGCVACYCLFSWTTHVTGGQFISNVLPVFIGFAMIGLRGNFELTAELSRTREEVVQLAANEERLRLARDMHDLTGQSLSMITLKSELAARLLGRLPQSTDRDRARDEVEEVAAVSRQTLRDIREALSGYRRPTLAVEIITARAALTSAGITVQDDADLTLLSGTFDLDAEAALAWCLREAVTNVVRHSGAGHCRIRLTQRGTDMVLTVRDDGTGPAGADETASEAAGLTTGSGLRGMSERLSAVDGSLELRPEAGAGFCLIAAVPVEISHPVPPPSSGAGSAEPAPGHGGTVRDSVNN